MIIIIAGIVGGVMAATEAAAATRIGIKPLQLGIIVVMALAIGIELSNYSLNRYRVARRG